jgi:GTP-binding protein
MAVKIALVGRPNVGKSALFNRICQRRCAIVDEQEGITRDRLYAEAECFGQPCVVIDTGGIDREGRLPFAALVARQARMAMEEADVVVWVVDGQVGVTRDDEEMGRELRRLQKPLILAVNKIDRLEETPRIASFHSLGVKHLFAVSAVQGLQVAEMLQTCLDQVNTPQVCEQCEEAVSPIRVAIVGRTNVGKSTLLNQLVGRERSIVSPIAGTTRDAIDVLHEEGDDRFLLVDTAGIRRKKAEKEVVDKFAAIRTEEAIRRAEICLFVLDSFEGFTTQERRIAHWIEEWGKSCVLLFNKWDLVRGMQMEHAKRGVREVAPFLEHCPLLFISAAQKRNLHAIFPLVKEVYRQRHQRLSTGRLNHFIEMALQKYHPPMITGKRLRIYYLTQVASAPPRFVLFVNQPRLMIQSYQKYLINQLREAFSFSGTPIFFELRGKEAPVTQSRELSLQSTGPLLPHIRYIPNVEEKWACRLRQSPGLE